MTDEDIKEMDAIENRRLALESATKLACRPGVLPDASEVIKDAEEILKFLNDGKEENNG